MAETGRTITLSDKRHGLPFSKGLLARSFTATGLSPRKAYEVAQFIQDDLRERGELSISMERLKNLATENLERMAGTSFAERYRRLSELNKIDAPIILLVGGTTGVGKSTIATEVAHRLGINRFVSTDSIREVMRAIFTKELMPALHASAFEAWRSLRVPVPQGANLVVLGFREQAAVVTSGVKALIERSMEEGVSLVIEGVHLVPGYIDPEDFPGARIVQILIAVEDEDAHRSHFYIREVQTDGLRPFERYRANFDHIRMLGHYIEQQAHEHGIRVIYSHQLDRTVADTLEHVVNEVLEASNESPKKGVPKKEEDG
ncbi:MAG: 2-phosphoglycerate kinase [Coriobacteriia bacterium]|jgi:2-phosphoglycerate kinase|nr:2-phosphoglycerate kinase [Coriobacteriia bacterium]